MPEKNNSPLVSVIMPTFNNAAFLSVSINSVLGQSCQTWELIIIDDDSTDSSQEIIKNLQSQDSRIKYVKHDINQGLIYSLNEALGLACGEFIARLDGDDYWLSPEKLEKQLAYLSANPNCALLGTGALVVGEKGNTIRKIQPPETDSQIRKQFLMRNCFIHSSIMARAEAIKKCELYKEHERYVEDYGLWLRIGKNYKLHNLLEPLVAYRLNPVGVTHSQNKNQIAAAKRLISSFKKDYPNFVLAGLKWDLQYLLSAAKMGGILSFLKNC